MTNFVCVLKSPLEVIFQVYIVIGPTKTGIFRQLLEAVNLVSYILQKLNQLERHSFPALSTFHRQIEPTLPRNEYDIFQKLLYINKTFDFTSNLCA